jgi:ubiquinone/menaquinone biosynthesis C-methylase UbiE
MLNYNHEADTYDVTRGGEARAAAAAAAAETLLPRGTARLADLACGTGIVTARLRRPRRKVIGIDLSPRMASIAATRLPGQIAVGDATRLPLADASADAAVMIWLLHLMDETASATTLAQAARVLRPGGVLLTTVDKNDANYAIDSDIAYLINAVRTAYATPQYDATDRVSSLAAQLDLTVTAKTTFIGKGQGRSPRQWRTKLLRGDFAWTKHASELIQLCEQLQALPDQDQPRPDPVYRLVQLTKAMRR